MKIYKVTRKNEKPFKAYHNNLSYYIWAIIIIKHLSDIIYNSTDFLACIYSSNEWDLLDVKKAETIIIDILIKYETFSKNKLIKMVKNNLYHYWMRGNFETLTIESMEWWWDLWNLINVHVKKFVNMKFTELN